MRGPLGKVEIRRLLILALLGERCHKSRPAWRMNERSERLSGKFHREIEGLGGGLVVKRDWRCWR